MKTLLWFRDDLRLHDNSALNDAAKSGQFSALFIYPEDLGGASYWWLYHSLKSLTQDLEEKGIKLILKTGAPEKVVSEVCAELNVDKVVWNRVYSPAGIATGSAVKKALEEVDVNCQSFNSNLLIEPTKVFNKQGTPFKVFTPFWRHCLSILSPSNIEEPEPFVAIDEEVASEVLEDWGLLPTKPNWAEGLQQRWQPGEEGAQSRWSDFLGSTIRRYKNGRDIPSEENTSMLSPHLAFGEISPRQIWFDTQQAIAANEIDSENGKKFLSEIGWREFSRYLLVHFPHIVDSPFNQRFEEFPWQDKPELVDAWKKGQTGYPIVDAGMRELWHTGYMHNRVRMVVASFLTKHCLTHWHEGMDWFWDTLVDADIGNNTASWQWASGCGADAAPYFRIFNPILQGEKFDKEGAYIKKWIPELANLPAKYINKPWEADDKILQKAKLKLGETYPFPIVDHKEARELALASYQAIKK